MLKMIEGVMEAIIVHAGKELPNEACGYLAVENGIVRRMYPLTNMDSAPDHFRMNPKEQFEAIRDMRKNRLQLCGVYHSHPETPARPSLEDLRLAYDPEISYVIVSLAGDRPVVKSFHIADGVATEEPIEVIGEKNLQYQNDEGLNEYCAKR